MKARRWILAKAAAYIALAVICYLLQTCVFSRLPLAGAKPLILPVIVVGVAMYEGCTAGAMFGLLCGILCDASMDRAAVLFTLALTAVGVGVGLLRRFFSRGLPAMAVCSAAALLVCAFLQTAGLFIYYQAPAGQLLASACMQTVYSVLFVLPLWPACRWVSRFSQAKGTV